VLEAIVMSFSQTIYQFTALVWQQLDQCMISITEDIVKQFVLSFVHAPALKSPQDQPHRSHFVHFSGQSIRTSINSNTIPVGSGGETPPGWCSVQQLSMITVCNAC